MMNCHDAVERLLEAAPADLRGAEGSPLGQHLAGCEACRTRADAVLAQQDLLGRGLAGIRPGRTPEEALRRVRSAVHASGHARQPRPQKGRDRRRTQEPEPRPQKSPRGTRRPRRGWRAGSWTRVAVPLAAAAAAAAILLTDRRDAADRATPPVDATRLARAEPAGVAPESDRSYAVFETDDPDISVIWFFEPEGETP